MSGLVRFNLWEYDFNFMGGMLQGGYFAGMSWAGQIADGGFRGGVRWTGNQEVVESYLTASLSVDYTFPNSIYLHAEVLFNGDGVTENAGLCWPPTQAHLQLSPSRWLLFSEVSGDIVNLPVKDLKRSNSTMKR